MCRLFLSLIMLSSIYLPSAQASLPTRGETCEVIPIAPGNTVQTVPVEILATSNSRCESGAFIVNEQNGRGACLYGRVANSLLDIYGPGTVWLTLTTYKILNCRLSNRTLVHIVRAEYADSNHEGELRPLPVPNVSTNTTQVWIRIQQKPLTKAGAFVKNPINSIAIAFDVHGHEFAK